MKFKMSANDEVGTSKQIMSVEEQARKANASFWHFSEQLEEYEENAGAAEEFEEQEAEAKASGEFKLEEAEEDAGVDGDREDDTTTDGGCPTEGGEEDATTTDGGGRTTCGRGNKVARKKKKKEERKEWSTPMLGTVCQDLTKVTEGGQPVAPEALARGYGLQFGCIV